MPGEIADMMLDGTMCQGCGVWLHGGEDGPGFPGWCDDCKPKEAAPRQRAAKPPRTIPCPGCNKKFRTDLALADHQRDAHQPKAGG